MKSIAIAAGLVALLTSCAPSPKDASLPHGAVPEPAPIVEAIRPACSFQTPSELENYIVTAIKANIPDVLNFYNERFGTDFSMNDMRVRTGTFDGLSPEFHYDFDTHELVLDVVPSEKALVTAREAYKNIPKYSARFANMDAYIVQLTENCERDYSTWEFYKSVTIGFTSHEVAHWYHGEFMKREGIVFPTPERDTPEWRGNAMVAEGTAVWMASLLDPDEGNFERYENPVGTFVSGGPWHFVYPAGQQLVTPILNADFISGLRTISTHPPKPRTTRDVVTYQSKVLSEITK